MTASSPETVIRALTGWDYTVIACYLVFVLGTGFLFKRVSKNASDYFRGGGNMLWWVAGMSAMMSAISTWSFTGAAAKVYDTGFLLPATWMLTALVTTPIMWMLAPRFRQMRVVTSIEAVCRRFGFGTEQFYTYLVLPMGLFWGGIGLNTVAVFMSAALGLPMTVTLVSLGIAVTFMSMLGGQWAVAAGDFVQGLLMFLVVGLVVWFSFALPEVGGVSGFIANMPERHTDFTVDARFGVVTIWILVSLVTNAIGTLNMQGEGAKFLVVKNGRHARGMVALRFISATVIPLTLFIQLPAMCAATVFPDLSLVFPQLTVPEEGAFVVMAFKTLPQGLLGLLICGMFAASLTTMDTALNRNAGYFVCNVYSKYIRRSSTPAQELRVGRITTVVFGGLTILVGLAFDALREINLFDVFLLLNAMVLLPSVVPVSLGTVIKRTPDWSGWSTVLAGFAAAGLAKAFYSSALVERVLGYATPFNARERVDMEFAFISIVVLVVSCAWFFFTMLFYDKAAPERRARTDAFFKDMRTPINAVTDPTEDQDHMQYQLIGLMCLVFGGATLLGALIPNPASGRIGFLFVGGVIGAFGLLFRHLAARKARQLASKVAPATAELSPHVHL